MLFLQSKNMGEAFWQCLSIDLVVLGLIWLCWAWFGCVGLDLVVLGCSIKLQHMVISAGQVFSYRVFTPQPSLMSGLKLDDNICKYAKDSGHMSEASDAFRIEEICNVGLSHVWAVDSGLPHVNSWWLCWVKFYLAWCEFEDKLQRNKLQGKVDVNLKTNCKVQRSVISFGLIGIWEQIAKKGWCEFECYMVRTSGHLGMHWQCKVNAKSMHLWPPNGFKYKNWDYILADNYNDDKDESDNDDKDEFWNGTRMKFWKSRQDIWGCNVNAPVISQWL